MLIQWYPGHMKKTKEMIVDNLKLVDIVIEILDARVPLSSKNPIIDKLVNNKPRLIILNKIDLANPIENEKWKRYFENNNTKVLFTNSNTGQGISKIIDTCKIILKDKIERNRKRGILNKPLRGMIVGIPNVGKSTLINKLVGKNTAKTGNKPGVTKSKQWIKLKGNFELLDTPGILWPKFDDQQVGEKLSFIGSIKDEIMDLNELAVNMITFFKDKKLNNIAKRYNIEDFNNLDSYQILENIACNRKFIKQKNELDIDRAAKVLFNEFRDGTLGKITLETLDN